MAGTDVGTLPSLSHQHHFTSHRRPGRKSRLPSLARPTLYSSVADEFSTLRSSRSGFSGGTDISSVTAQLPVQHNYSNISPVTQHGPGERDLQSSSC